ncbi:dehydrogenase/reductase SDR family member 12-like isoform X1 [Homalodisca vitripennis]|uniref:dehydrogenase/reductase SDR family member 12-like isoform X1 n=1 Tax=Homalodisca vitripennis TaxID=197043 RepID=UPI001EEA2468|nr:dehydrogenase/reductase SDR family member 12-like isoform X1 [Homalodisca vitripennis]
MAFYRKAVWFYRGWKEYTQEGYIEAEKSFNPTDLDVNLKGKSYIITGATSGIGKCLTEEIAKRGGTVHMVCRNMQEAEVIRYSLIDQTKNNEIHLHVLDLSHPRSVYQFTQEFREQFSCLDAIIHNAGCMVYTCHVDPDGIEKNFAINVLSPHIITRQLVPLLHKSERGRVVFVSSGCMLVQKLDPTDIQCQSLKQFDGMHVYANNKRQQVVLAEMYSREYPQLFCAAMHPGWTDTKGVQTTMPEFYARMQDRLRTPRQGADTALWLAISPAPLKNTSGLFYQDRVAIPTHMPLSFTKPTLQEEDSFIKQVDHLMERMTR